MHWAAKARATKKYREWSCLAGIAAIRKSRVGGLPWRFATTEVTYYRRDRRGMRDADNALSSLKSALDGLVDAGLLVDDRGLTHKPVRQEVDGKNPRVEIVLTPTGASN